MKVHISVYLSIRLLRLRETVNCVVDFRDNHWCASFFFAACLGLYILYTHGQNSNLGWFLVALEEGMRRRRRLDVSPTFNCRPRPKQNIIENGETLDTYHYTFQATATEKKHRRHNCKSKLFWNVKVCPKLSWHIFIKFCSKLSLWQNKT